MIAPERDFCQGLIIKWAKSKVLVVVRLLISSTLVVRPLCFQPLSTDFASLCVQTFVLLTLVVRPLIGGSLRDAQNLGGHTATLKSLQELERSHRDTRNLCRTKPWRDHPKTEGITPELRRDAQNPGESDAENLEQITPESPNPSCWTSA